MNLHFVIDGTVHSNKTWPACPRVGDHVTLGPSYGELVVTKCVWGTHAMSQDVSVDVHLSQSSGKGKKT